MQYFFKSRSRFENCFKVTQFESKVAAKMRASEIIILSQITWGAFSPLLWNLCIYLVLLIISRVIPGAEHRTNFRPAARAEPKYMFVYLS